MHFRLRSSNKKNLKNAEESPVERRGNLPKVRTPKIRNRYMKELTPNEEKSKGPSNLNKQQQNKKNEKSKSKKKHQIEANKDSEKDQDGNLSKERKPGTRKIKELSSKWEKSAEKSLSNEKQHNKNFQKDQKLKSKKKLQLESIKDSQVEKDENLSKVRKPRTRKIIELTKNVKELNGISQLDEQQPYVNQKSKSKNCGIKKQVTSPQGKPVAEVQPKTTDAKDSHSKVRKPRTKQIKGLTSNQEESKGASSFLDEPKHGNQLKEQKSKSKNRIKQKLLSLQKKPAEHSMLDVDQENHVKNPMSASKQRNVKGNLNLPLKELNF